MALMILQIDFVDQRLWESDRVEALSGLAHIIAKTPGLIWKIWTENPDTKEAGGVYLFRDEASLNDYLTVHTARLKGFGIEHINVKMFQVNEPLTQITGALLTVAT
jgi:Putative mono-oxygenase ydhR